MKKKKKERKRRKTKRRNRWSDDGGERCEITESATYGKKGVEKQKMGDTQEAQNGTGPCQKPTQLYDS